MLTLTSFSSPNSLQEAVHGGDIVVVLVLGWLLRLRLDQDGALEADLVLVVDDQLQEAPGLRALALQVGVEQRLIALAAAPQHIVFAASAAWSRPCRHFTVAAE